MAGVRDPEVAVPLATTTGWNFRAASVGNRADIYQLLGAYIPFATTLARRAAVRDPRLSIEERYRDRDEYLGRVQSAATTLIREGLMLEEDLQGVLAGARAHWAFATGALSASTARPEFNGPVVARD